MHWTNRLAESFARLADDETTFALSLGLLFVAVVSVGHAGGSVLARRPLVEQS